MPHRVIFFLTLLLMLIMACAPPPAPTQPAPPTEPPAATPTEQPPDVNPPPPTETLMPTPTESPTAVPTPEPDAGTVRIDAFGIEQVYVPAGCFLMGTSDEEADYARSLDGPAWALNRIETEQVQHEVCLTKGFWIDRYEVTNAAYDAFIEAGGYDNPELWSEDGWTWRNRQNAANLGRNCINNAPADHPRVCVTWFEAEAYANWRQGQLPTEAQWEYAARGPNGLIYPWGNQWDPTLANVEDSDGLTPVGSYPAGASWVGALDMAGNAMEWVQDWLRSGYPAETRTDPTGPETGQRKIEKGGWWGSNAVVTRAAYRHFEDPPNYQDHHIGFRVVTP